MTKRELKFLLLVSANNSRNPWTVSELARRAKEKQSNASRLLIHLWKAKLLFFWQDERDARKKYYFLTRKGWGLLRQMADTNLLALVNITRELVAPSSPGRLTSGGLRP